MPRYATLVTGDDGAEIVSAIGEFESCGPLRRAGCFEQVVPDVRIGMVRGGPLEAVGGFGFPRRGFDPSAVIAATARLKALTPSETAAPKSPRAKPRKKPARKKPRAAARAPAPDAGAHG